MIVFGFACVSYVQSMLCLQCLVNVLLPVILLVELIADCRKREIHVRQLGCNPCKVGRKLLARGETAVATEQETLCVLANKYEHYFKFEAQSPCGSGSGKEKPPSRSGIKRNAEEDGNGKNAKQARVDDLSKKEDIDNSDESDSEHMEAVKRQLKLLKENMKKVPAVGDMKKAPDIKREHVHKNTSADTKAVGGDCRRETDRTGMVQRQPTTEAIWKEHESLLLYTSKGVVGKSKVSLLAFIVYCIKIHTI